MENNLEDIKQKYEINLDLLKQKEKENQNLLSKIKNKEDEFNVLQKKMSNSASNQEHKPMNSSNLLNLAETNDEIEELKKEVKEKSKQIEQLKDEINNMKILNNQLIQDNNRLKDKNFIKKNFEDESEGGGKASMILEKLRDEIKEKNIQIEKLIKENNYLKNKKDFNLNDEEEKEINNMQESIPISISKINDKLNDDSKIKKYFEEIKMLKTINESDMMQIKALKADIKDLKEKVKKMETFSGQLKNYNEFIVLINKVLGGFRPKKKDQKEAFDKLVTVINNHHI